MPRDVAKPHRNADALSAAALIANAWQYLREVTQSLRLAGKRWQLDDAGTMAAAVAYYLALSLFPLLLLLTSGVGLFLKFTNLGQDAKLQILAVVAEHCSPSLEVQVRTILLQFENQSIASGPFGLLTAILAAVGVFHQFERAFDKIWRIPAVPNHSILDAILRVLTQRLMAFLLMASLGLTIVAILAANVAIGAVREWMLQLKQPGTVAITLVDASATMVMNSLAFGCLYRFLPKRRVRWIDALRSGLLVAIIWEASRQLLSVFLVGMHYTTAYGAIGSFIALLLWFYWGVSILFYGAEYVQVLSRRHIKPMRMFREDLSAEETQSPETQSPNTNITPRRTV